MKKYDYYINGKIVSRQEFFNVLKAYCYKTTRVCTIAGWCGVDMEEFDEKQYNKYIRQIQNGYGLILGGGVKKSRSFMRKETR